MRNLTIIVFLIAGCGTPTADPTPDAGAAETGDAAHPDAALDAAPGAWSVDDYYKSSEIGPVPPYPQRSGDATRGYDILVNEGYVSCGVPGRIYDQYFGGEVPDGTKLAGRRGANADMPFNQTRFDRDGIELVSSNCLTCHANVLPTGELYIGLGYEGNYTTNFGRFVELGRGLVDETNEREVFEYDRFLERTLAIQPFIQTDTIGVNPADNIAGVLTAHRDPDTWEWLAEPWYELPDIAPIPLSVPPWWHASRKNALYYTSVGRGDHARFMMAAALLCTDSEEEARAIDEMFVDVQAFIESVEPPPYPYPVDTRLADEGKQVFEDTCSRCHGTYGPQGEYPNLVIAIEEVGTDPVLAAQGGLGGREPVAWLNRSFFGEVSIVAPAPGYVAPPLDGIWATAPYLHNASVPTLAKLLNSPSRPLYWTRDFQAIAYDTEAIGFQHTALAGGKDSVETNAERYAIYDTTQPGYSNQGHTFGDALTVVERTALLEYLKTL